MFEWLFLLFSPVAPDAAPPKQDYIGLVAAEVAYASLLPDTAPVKPKVPTKDCRACNGTGRVRSGDGHEWTKCGNCDPTLPALKSNVYSNPPTPPTPTSR
jgi:hypothetical protein